MKMKDKKAEVRRRIIDAAVDLMSEDGFKNVSMRKIAKAAEVGDATIYNYFPSKEKILYGYFEVVMEDTLKELDTIEEFDSYQLHEKVQCFIETNLSLLLSNREFVSEAFDLAYLSPLAKFGSMAPIRAKVSETFEGYLHLAYENEELEPQAGSSFLPSLFWDYYVGILAYWLKDDSEDFTQTTQLIDLSLAFAMSVLESGVLNRAGDMVSFLFRHHLFSGFDYLTKAMSTVRTIKRR
ncbi:putative Regulatory protein, TetR [Vibrio nigripulchritudo MADA3029]|uniref:TetR family transcriptional regulator n=1 Tax=Vibrio nigripulchritudo TaxID=28173 RepID=UPI0003B1BD78|nr:TetR family transcriptional regulator [Vibrio nigripulchritudo]CCN45708.1 putative Regulatory protein, TetR [Vibrio nigripulchritudo MADA3020]CCN52949.1 putative Regulatory protein, TetR [Vibrio nigripulchritudo MADA3021]CCN61615.1 putative Regulatory protein, TetR [Vibrio nigripulchritudo MADA3029]